MIYRIKQLSSLLILISVINGLSYGSEIKVIYSNDAGRIESLKTIEKDNVSFVSGTELAKLLEAGTFYSEPKKKLDLKFKEWRVKLSAYSSYILMENLSSADRHDDILHLPVPVMPSDNDILIPFNAFMTILDAVMPENLTYDDDLKTLEIRTALVNITGVSIQRKSNGTLIKISTTREFPLDSYRAWINRDLGWLYLTIVNGISDSISIISAPTNGAVVKVVPVQMEESTQLSFKLKGEVENPEIYQTTNPHQIVISLRTPERITRKQVEDDLLRNSERWLIDTIVLDAGHGGKDPGSISASGLKEKDVVLDIVKRIGKLIEKKLKVNVVYTREEDVYVSLEERGKIANRNEGKLFISIHLNSFPKNRNVRGFEVYILRPGKTASAIEVAERENSVLRFDDKSSAEKFEKQATEKLILASLTQAAFMSESEDLSGMLEKELKKKISSPSRGVKQAGFYVLVGASMPHAYIEAGFISNRIEEKNFRSSKYKQKFAEAVYEGVRKFKHKYEQLILSANGRSN
ncbi:MAG: N-acetylmuramoyl-L-alanine amidase [Candidatus Marinimicrobia bacterium]|nr:N-acetylmuramoyl-L-alanine amidase [Candidatus Neomarinimicrobiota bacterium]TFB11380.1 N-acetylmuramoyl-L-alanine amidase [Candidatus Marinimicrobia bacterium MT.SAG.2]